MEITGKIIKALPLRSGVSARTGNEWQSQEYVIEYDERYPKRCAFSVFGADRIKEFALKEGMEGTVSFDIDAQEYKERWYNKLQAWKFTPRQAEQQPTQQPQAAPTEQAAPFPPQTDAQGTPQASAQEGDDLPF